MIRLSNWRRYGDTFQVRNLLDRRRIDQVAPSGAFLVS